MTGLKPEQASSIGESGSLSLELLYRRHFSWLMRAVRQRFGRDQAEDLVQETYARVAASQGVAIRNPKAFLMQVATRVAIDQERRRVVRSDVLVASSGVSDIADQAAQAELLLLKQVILGLPMQLRGTFLLSRVAGLTYEEIAEREGVALKTIEWRMSKALKLCATALAANNRSWRLADFVESGLGECVRRHPLDRSGVPQTTALRPNKTRPKNAGPTRPRSQD